MACLYQVAIKVLAYYTKAPNYRWNTYIPQSDMTKLSFENPLHPAMVKARATPGYHVELYYHEGCHYDRIAPPFPVLCIYISVENLPIYLCSMNHTFPSPMLCWYDQCGRGQSWIRFHALYARARALYLSPPRISALYIGAPINSK